MNEVAQSKRVREKGQPLYFLCGSISTKPTSIGEDRVFNRLTNTEVIIVLYTSYALTNPFPIFKYTCNYKQGRIKPQKYHTEIT